MATTKTYGLGVLIVIFALLVLLDPVLIACSATDPDKIEIEKENCDCNPNNVLIENPNGKGSFDEIGLLPAATGDTIDFNPTVVPSAIPSDSPHGGLSTGAKAGIGVGVGIGGLLLIAGAAFLFFRLRRRGDTRHVDTEKSELDGHRADIDKSELSGNAREQSLPKSELSAENKVVEMESPQSAAELETRNDYPVDVKRSTDE
jgi:hypothetical protein